MKSNELLNQEDIKQIVEKCYKFKVESEGMSQLKSKNKHIIKEKSFIKSLENFLEKCNLFFILV